MFNQLDITDMDARMKRIEEHMEDSMRNLMREQKREKGFYYEVWIDFYEDFESEIYPAISNMPHNDAVKYCLKYMERREQFYSSPRYYQMLNRMVADIKEEDFVSV
jgi:hypothetical protein